MSCPPWLQCQIDNAQAAVEAAFTDTVIISRPSSVVSDGAGGYYPSSGTGYDTIATVQGLLTTTRLLPGEREMGATIQAPVPYAIFLPVGTDVRQQDRLIIGTRTFEAQGVAVAASIALSAKVYCSELQ